MSPIDDLFQANREWAASVRGEDPEFFVRLSKSQSPNYLWIGCADSRVPANQIVGLRPGEVFVHRNIANLVVHTDFNCLTVIEYAVHILRVEHIIVCGHYGCGGVAAANENNHLGLIDNWLRHIRDVRQTHQSELHAIDDLGRRLDRLCELNVIEQVHNVARTTIVQEAWDRGQTLSVHGWIYRIQDGILQNLDVTMTNNDHLAEAYRLDRRPE